MKKFRLLSLTVIPFLLSGCQKNVDPNLLKKDTEVTLVSHFGEHFGEDEYTDTCFYSDYWFLEDSSTLNYELALMSAMASGAAYSNSKDLTGIKITNLLNNIGFTEIQENSYYANGVTLSNSIGVIAAQKQIKNWSGKEYTLLAVFPRSAGYYSEWVGNFNVGKTGIHTGFLEARDEMLRFIKHYINATNISGDLKVWSAGYSRGAAVANLVGGYLCEDSGYFGELVRINSSDVFTYTIGTPRAMVENLSKAKVLSVSGPRGDGYTDTNIPAYIYSGEGTINPTGDQYKGIHNFVATGDFVSKLPTAGLGFTRYGESLEITYGEPAMLDYLRELSPETASKFYGNKNYTSILPTTTFDLEKFTMVDGKGRQSADQMLDKAYASLMGLVDNSREKLMNSSYADILGAMTAIFGVDSSAITALVSDIGDVAKAAALTYFAYASEKQNLEPNKAITNIVLDLLSLMGKTVENRDTYTDQQLLKDLFDYLINDYQTSDKAAIRSALIAGLIPEPYNNLFTGALEYAKTKEITVTYVDDLLYLVASYMTDNKENEAVQSTIVALAGLIPEQYVSMLSFVTGKQYPDDQYPTTADKAKAGVTDILELCAKGNDANPDYVYRSAMLSFVIPMAVGTEIPEAIMNLLVNGAKDSDGVTVTRDPLVLSAFVDEVLKFALPKDAEDKPLSLNDAANQAICDLLDNAKTEKTEQYVNLLKEHPEQIRELLITILFNPGETYSLASDIENAVTFIDTIQFLFPAHNHEMYICYFKAARQN